MLRRHFKLTPGTGSGQRAKGPVHSRRVGECELRPGRAVKDAERFVYGDDEHTRFADGNGAGSATRSMVSMHLPAASHTRDCLIPAS